jgi:RHS repeat-associated protein
MPTAVLPDATTTTYYYAGSQHLAQRTNAAAPVWTLGDHLGSTSFSVDSTNTVSELRYMPWGKTRYESGVTPTDRRYTGQIQDASDLYFYNARYYDPTLGRFLQADTLVPEPGNPQSWNRYSYVNNNPLRYTDPTGHCRYDEEGNIDKWNCSIDDFDNMTLVERQRWLLQFMIQTNCGVVR